MSVSPVPSTWSTPPTASDASPSSTVQICSESKAWSGPELPSDIATSHRLSSLAPSEGDASVVITAFGVAVRRVLSARTRPLLGHPDARPLHGFALQAIGSGSSISELGRRLGVSKQAAAKTASSVVRLGYASRAADR